MEPNNKEQAAPVSTKNPTPRWKQWAKDGLDLVKFALIALVIVLPIRFFVAQPFIVSGSSMFHTFQNGQYLIVDELSYHFRAPQRDDVIIFHYPLNTKLYFIKRIIGLPNETIIINKGVVTIKNAEHPDGFVLAEPYINEPFATDGTYTTGPDQYFVMGDNRNYSSDSRVWGTVPGNLIVGRAYLRLFPFSELAVLPGHVTPSTE